MWGVTCVRSHVEAHYSCKLSAEDVLEQYDLKRQEWFIAGYALAKQSTGSVHAEAGAADLRGQSRKQFVGTAPEARDCNNELRRELLEARREEREAAAAAPPPRRRRRGRRCGRRRRRRRRAADDDALAATAATPSSARRPAPPAGTGREAAAWARRCCASSGAPARCRRGAPEPAATSSACSSSTRCPPCGRTRRKGATYRPVAAATMEARMREVGLLALYGTREAARRP